MYQTLQGKTLCFDEIIKANTDDGQSMGQKPITYIRQASISILVLIISIRFTVLINSNTSMHIYRPI